MASQCLSTDDLCLLTNNLPTRVKFPEISPHRPAKVWIPSFEGMTRNCGEEMTKNCGERITGCGEGMTANCGGSLTALGKNRTTCCAPFWLASCADRTRGCGADRVRDGAIDGEGKSL